MAQAVDPVGAAPAGQQQQQGVESDGAADSLLEARTNQLGLVEESARDMYKQFPPRFANASKQYLHGLATQAGSRHPSPANPNIRVSRWSPTAADLSAMLPVVRDGARAVHEMREDVFSYDEPGDALERHWHLNFAHSNLFCAYPSGLFAQDELQVSEHPILASVRECLFARCQAVRKAKRLGARLDAAAAEPVAPLTVGSDGIATPILIANVERWCSVDTAPCDLPGRAHGIYGNWFSRSPPEAVKSATTILDPPTLSNIIAIEAPHGGRTGSAYSKWTVDYAFNACYTAFRAAVVESRILAGSESARTVIHTGNWGCGAYGGHKTLLAALQILAADAAGVSKLVFHTFSKEFSDGYVEAARLVARLLLNEQPELGSQPAATYGEVVEALFRLKFHWGMSDGN